MNDSTQTTGGNFLERTVSKAYGTQTVLAPRLPSLYEPVAESGIGHGLDAALPETEIGAEQEETAVARSPGVISAIMQSNVRVSSLPPLATSGQEPTTQAGNAGGQIRGEPTNAVRPIPERFDNGLAAAVPRALAAWAVALPEVYPQPPARASTPSVELLVSAAPLHEERRSPLIDRHDTNLIDAKSQSVSNLKPPLLVAQPVTLHPRPEPALRENHPPQPVISVTIGRVEVRATQAPTTPRAQRKQAQPMSLDEYLKKREARP